MDRNEGMLMAVKMVHGLGERMEQQWDTKTVYHLGALLGVKTVYYLGALLGVKMGDQRVDHWVCCLDQMQAAWKVDQSAAMRVFVWVVGMGGSMVVRSAERLDLISEQKWV